MRSPLVQQPPKVEHVLYSSQQIAVEVSSLKSETPHILLQQHLYITGSVYLLFDLLYLGQFICVIVTKVTFLAVLNNRQLYPIS